MVRSSEIFKEIKLLYVKNNLREVEQIKKLFSKNLNNLYVTDNFSEGLDLVQKYNPNIVVTDIATCNSDIDGLDFIKRIRENDARCGIIITTAIRDLKKVLKVIDIGIDKYLLETVDEISIAKEIEEVAQKVLYNRIELHENYSFKLKKEIEDQVKLGISNFFKKTMGKGPNDIKVKVNKNKIEINNYGTLTLMEQSLVTNKSYAEIVAYNRKLFYSKRINDLEQIISEALMRKSKINSIDIDISMQLEKITCEIN